jgi:hypothetical protein
MTRLANPLKAAAVSEFSGLKYEGAGRKVMTILDVMIDETRKDNDTARGDAVLSNQGAISMLLALKMYLEADYNAIRPSK